MTNLSDLYLKNNIEKNLFKEVDLLKKYLIKLGKASDIKKIDEDILVLHDGSQAELMTGFQENVFLPWIGQPLH